MEFQYVIPSQIIFGNNSSQKIDDIVKSFGGKTVFCIYDKGIKQAGIADQIVKIMKDAGIRVFEYDGVQANPPDTLVEEVAKIAKSAAADVFVAIGGGSSIDCAKAVNILQANPSPINQYDGLGLVKKPGKPLIAIPTTAGTGSEVTSFGIVTDTKRKKKMVIGGSFCGATIALIDPLLTLGMPPAITASTGMDALTHAIEAYVSKNASVPTDVNALRAIDLIYNNLVNAYENGQDVGSRANMILGSMLAGFAFNSAVLGLVHSIAHPLSVHCGLPHGVANAIGLPHVMEYNAATVPEKMKDIAAAMGLPVKGLSAKDGSQVAIDAVKALSKRLAIPTLKDAGVKRKLFDRIAEDALLEVSTLFNPRLAIKEDVIGILEQAW